MLIELRNRMKIIKTCILYLSLFTLGTAMSLTGPCLLDLQHMVRTDTQHIAMVYTARSTGYLLGAIIEVVPLDANTVIHSSMSDISFCIITRCSTIALRRRYIIEVHNKVIAVEQGAVLFDLMRLKQAVLMVCNLFIAITMFGIPWCRNVKILMVFMCINGFCLGAIETGGNVVCLNLWGKDSNPFFQGMHFAFSLGGLLSPLIAAPFLENIKELSQHMVSNIDNTTYLGEELVNSAANFSDFSINITHFSEGIPKIVYPFSILGVIALLVTVLNVGVCIISPTEDESPKDDTKIDTSERSLLFMFFIFILTFVAFFVVAGSEIGFGQTLTIYSVKGSLHLTTVRGSYITSAFWAAFCVTRLSGVFLSMKISCLKLLIGNLCLVAIASLILLFLMPNEWALWLASVIYGTGIGSCYASLVGWINTHIIITNKLSAFSTIGCAAGEMIIPFLITYFIDTIPEMFSFSIASSVILTTILLFVLNCMFKSGRKTKKSENVECYVTDAVCTKD